LEICLEVVTGVIGFTMAATYIVAGRRLVRTLRRRISHLFALTYNQASSNKFHLDVWS